MGQRMSFSAEQIQEMSNAVRAAAVRMIRIAKSGHIGIALGAADILTTVYANHLNLSDMENRNRFVMSCGHGSALLYSILKSVGYKIGDLESFRKFGGLAGHPEYGLHGVESTTGPLGQGVGNAVGMAIAAKIKKQNTNIYCLCSDGDLSEGVTQEAIVFAGKYKLNNLILLWDDNGVTIDGRAVLDVDVPKRFAAAGWNILFVNGNAPAEIDNALNIAKRSEKPVFIQCKTIIGFGSSKSGTSAAHSAVLSNDELINLETKFYSAIGENLWAEFRNKYSNIGFQISQIADKKTLLTPSILKFENMESTREISGKYISQLIFNNPNLIGGSADLAESTNTLVPGMHEITPNDFSGNFINFGVREHAMAAIMNGLAVSGLRSFIGTFLVFSDYMRPSMRIAALSGLPVIYVLTHDSVAIGEDGPTHQPIEQLPSLRLIPNMNVFRPCNCDEVVNAWDTALIEIRRPSCIILSRQKFAQVITTNSSDIIRGAYVIYESKIKSEKNMTTILASGSEVSLAIQVAQRLENIAVVSVPCVEIFRSQPTEYKNKILRGRVIAIEAARAEPWFEFADGIIGIDTFGRNGDGKSVYESFGFQVDAITDEIKKHTK